MCLRGYLGSEGMAASSRATREKRLEVVKILLEHGADINIKSGIVEMTPLHWAAYNKDPNVVAYLLRQGAKMSFSKRKSNGDGGLAAVDVAGVCGHEEVVYVFAKWLEAVMLKEMIAAGSVPDVQVADLENGAEPDKSKQTEKGGYEALVEKKIRTEDMKKALPVDPDTGKTIIELAKVRRTELNEDESAELRIFYWAAYFGRSKTVNRMVMHRKWSPFIKSFREQSVMTGAIKGERVNIVQRLAGGFEYKATEETSFSKFLRDVFNKDLQDNSCLHYAYAVDNPQIRQILKDNGFSRKDMPRNVRGQLPRELRHAKKCLDSDDEDFANKAQINDD